MLQPRQVEHLSPSSSYAPAATAATAATAAPAAPPAAVAGMARTREATIDEGQLSEVANVQTQVALVQDQASKQWNCKLKMLSARLKRQRKKATVRTLYIGVKRKINCAKRKINCATRNINCLTRKFGSDNKHSSNLDFVRDVVGMEDFQMVQENKGAGLLLCCVGRPIAEKAEYPLVIEALAALHASKIYHGDARLDNAVFAAHKVKFIDFRGAQFPPFPTSLHFCRDMRTLVCSILPGPSLPSSVKKAVENYGESVISVQELIKEVSLFL